MSDKSRSEQEKAAPQQPELKVSYWLRVLMLTKRGGGRLLVRESRARELELTGRWVRAEQPQPAKPPSPPDQPRKLPESTTAKFAPPAPEKKQPVQDDESQE